MIRIKKGPIPTELEENHDRWTNAFKTLKDEGVPIPSSIQYRYRHAEIKSQIVADSHGKCSYCETKITAAQPGDVEHIYPSSKRPELAFAWNNLVLACTECNRRKSDYHSETEQLVNPVEDDPERHIVFSGPFAVPAPGSQKGLLTERLLDLNRAPLFERRYDRLRSLWPLLDLWATSMGRRKAILEQQIEAELSNASEYASMVRRYVNCLKSI